MDKDGAELIVSWFVDVEQRLAGLLTTVPYSPNTKDVFVPPLSGIILEACSLLDVVFREQMVPKQPKANICDFRKFYEKEFSLSAKGTLFYRHPVVILRPFQCWGDPTATSDSPPWWKNYNALKHNRVESYSLSTLETAVEAVCAIHQAISAFPIFYEAMKRHGFLHGRSDVDWKLREVFCREVYYADIPEVMVETALFGTPCVRPLPESVDKIEWETYRGGPTFRRHFTAQ